MFCVFCEILPTQGVEPATVRRSKSLEINTAINLKPLQLALSIIAIPIPQITVDGTVWFYLTLVGIQFF